MSMTTAATRPPLWRDIRVLRVVLQLAIVAVVGAFGLWLWTNLQTNTSRSNIPLGFDYLNQPSDISVPGNPFRPTQSVRDAVMVGLGNTLRVAVVGIIMSTVLGTMVGILRLSSNWLVSNMARVYVEAVRNIPLLVLIITFYRVVFLRFPRIESATEWGDWFIASVRGVAVPWFTTGEQGGAILAVLAGAAIIGYLTLRWRRAVNERTGQPAYAVSAALGAFVVAAVVGHALIGSPIGVTTPAVDRRTVRGGITLSPEYAALLVSLVVYTSSHIAEIVRGSIQAVHKGQGEAASALALNASQRMRLIILPQAMRIAVPALGNQYLNLTKNSSLAVAISYFELTKITTLSIGNRAPAVPSFTLLLLIYLVLSLVISAIVNIVNRRLALVER